MNVVRATRPDPAPGRAVPTLASPAEGGTAAAEGDAGSWMNSMYDTMPIHPGLEALADGFSMLDPQGRVVYWNATAARLLGVPRDRALGRAVSDVVPALAADPAAARLRAALEQGEVAEFPLPPAPGTAAPRLTLRADPLAGGGLALHFRPAPEQEAPGPHHAHLLESIRDGLLAVDADGRIDYANPVARRVLRLSGTEPERPCIWDLIPDHWFEIRALLRAALNDAQPRHLRRVAPEGIDAGKRVFDVWLRPLPGGGLSLLFRDVSHGLQRERDLARYAAEADEANRAKSRFFAAVSHELRTPLNAIVGYTHLLSTDTYGAMPAGAMRAASRASVCAEHLAQLIDDLLLLTTAEIDRLPVASSPITLATFLPSALEPVRQQAEAKGLRFGIKIDADVPVLETDPDRFRQLLNALLSNAVKFTQRGEILVVASGVGVNGSDAALQPGAPAALAEGICIRVRDTGPGIPYEAQARIFEAFEQLGDTARSDSLRRGPGLGLTVARHLARLLKGSLTLEQTGHQGSEFRLDLPLRVE
jgi:signal transduction histidine kinase